MQIVETPAWEDIQFLEDRLYEHNSLRTGHDDGKLLAIFLRDEAGDIIAGLHGWTWAGWLEIRLLWVHPDQRGQGLGKALLFAAEQKARERGCNRAVLDSYSFQAPDFYRKFGYEVFATLDGFPEPHRRLYLTKTLG